MSDGTKTISELSNAEVEAAARAKLGELAAHDLRFHFAKLAKVYAGGPVEGGQSDHQITRSALRQLLSDLALSKGDVS